MRLLCNLQALLYDIISVLITKKLKIFILVQHQFLDNFSILISRIVFKTLLYYIWTELLLRQIYEITNKLFSNSLIDLRNLKIQNKLNNIVSIWIHDKNESVFSNAFYDHHFLIRCSCVDTFLHYTAAVLVTSNLHTVFTDCIVYELVVLSSPFFQYFLYYVISVYFVAHVQYNWLYIFLHK